MSRPVFQGEYPGWRFEPGFFPGSFKCFSRNSEGQDPVRKLDHHRRRMSSLIRKPTRSRKGWTPARKSQGAQRCDQRAANAHFVQVMFPESVWRYIFLFSSYFSSVRRRCSSSESSRYRFHVPDDCYWTLLAGSSATGSGSPAIFSWTTA
jgi:hypothetical protein